MAPTKQEILAASAGGVAVTLNVVPGLGAGYLYQRHWKEYWITSALATSWFVLGAVIGQGADAAEEVQNTGESQSVATANVMAPFEKLKKSDPEGH